MSRFLLFMRQNYCFLFSAVLINETEIVQVKHVYWYPNACFLVKRKPFFVFRSASLSLPLLNFVVTPHIYSLPVPLFPKNPYAHTFLCCWNSFLLVLANFSISDGRYSRFSTCIKKRYNIMN